MRALALGLVAALLGGCFGGSPTPLAPGLSGAVGLPHRGVLTGAAKLPDRGPGFTRFRNDDVRWGHPRLVSAIEAAAADVARRRPGGPALVVGDLAERRGGASPRHRSHRTGRDVDLLLFTTTPSGAPIPSPGFVRFGGDGLAKHPKKDDRFVRFDVARNWLLVRALVESPHAEAQWIFLSRPLEALLVEHALARGEDPELVWHAETVLLQPSDSAAHDDHFHVRIACRPSEAIAGCEGGGPWWPWLAALPALAAPERELVHALLAPAEELGGDRPEAALR